MTIEFRLAVPDEFRALSNTVANSLLFPPRDDAGWAAIAEPSWHESISYGAWDGAQCVGNVSHFVVDTTVPGGRRVATGAISRVGVLATHRRRGIASGLMERLVGDAVERDLTLMSLRASEAVIYERYGFGMAGQFTEAKIDPVRARPVSGAAATGSIGFVARDRIFDTVKPIYEASLHRRPGLVTRPHSWWARYFEDALAVDKSSYVVVHSAADGTHRGYAHYGVEWSHDAPGGPVGKGEIHDVTAIDDATELALWSYLLDIDLIRSWTCDERPVDDIVRHAIHDMRAYATTTVDDEQWVRLVDVDAALTARSYNSSREAVTIAVTDPLVPANDGTWLVTADGASRSGDRPDIVIDIATLSAAYLGGTSWYELAAAGRVATRDAHAITRADTLFASRPLPFCGSFF